MFFKGLVETNPMNLSQTLGEHAFNSALTLMSLYRYESALIMFISSVEAFLSDIDYDPENVDKRSIYQKLSAFEKRFPDILRNFKYYSESDENPKKLMKDAIDLRNTIAHANSTNQTQAGASCAILTTLLPMLQAIHKSLFNMELTERLVGLEQLFSISFYLRKNGDLVGNDWTRALAPITWGIQNIISPNYAPKYLWDDEGYENDRSEYILRAWLHKRAQSDLDEEQLCCPICDHISVGLRFSINAEDQIEIDEAHCVNCQLELGNTPLDTLMSQSLFDAYFTEHEPRLRKEFGLS